MKNFLKGVIHTIELMGILSLAFATQNPFIIITSLIPSLVVASRLSEDINGNKIENSIFSVYSSGKIYQNSISHPIKMLGILKDKDKGKRFTEEAISMFLQMDVRDKKGNLKKYKTKSQAKTLFLLKQLERNGYIENLEHKSAGKMHLVVEKLEMGNPKGMNKKHQMYNISFNLTDKVRTKEDLMNLALNKETKKEVVYTPVVENKAEKKEESNIVNFEKEKEELLKLKEELLNSNQEVEKDRTL